MRLPGTARTTTTVSGPAGPLRLHYMTNETYYVASGEHVMKAFVEVEDGEQLRGKHFPQGLSEELSTMATEFRASCE